MNDKIMFNNFRNDIIDKELTRILSQIICSSSKFTVLTGNQYVLV